MARRLRVQYEGALYHVLNLGNYRRDVFETAGAAQAFVTTLEEDSAQYGWRVYAYVVMRNHYHLAIETPKANLVDGMHWLQGTLATRFNRFRNERGHLFQGRYQAILLEDFPGHESGFAVLSRGWAIGTLGWRKALAQDYSHQALSPGLEAEQLWVRAEAAEASQRSIGEEIAGRC